MRTRKWIVAGLFAIMLLAFIGCPQAQKPTPTPQPETPSTSLTERIRDASNTSDSIDFNNTRVAEDAAVNSRITIKNLKMGGKTLTINANGVVLDSVSEAVVIIGESVGNGTVILDNCKDITKLVVNGGGSNSVHLSHSEIESVQIKKDKVRVVLENTKVLEKVAVEADSTKLEVNDETPTASVAASNVPVLEIAATVEDVNIKDAKIEKISVKAAGSSTAASTPAINMAGSIEVAEIEGKNVSVVLAKNAEITSTVSVKATNLTLEMKNSNAKVENLEIDGAVKNVNISGGTIEKIEVKTNTSDQTDQTPAINITGNVAITEVTGTTTLNVAEDIIDDFEEPDGITVETIRATNVTLVKKNIKTEYITRENFDYSGLFAEVTYSNSTKQTVTLTRDNCTVSGFNSSTDGTVTVTISYGGEQIGSFTVTIKKVVTGTTLVKKNTTTETVKTEYIQGTSFDYSGLYAEISYSDSTTEKIKLTAANCTVSGFDSSRVGTVTVKITYDGKEIGSFTVNIIEDAETAEIRKVAADGYISQAIDKLMPASGNPDVDGAVGLFKKAYDTYKTDKTRLYYALAELASISTDESVAKLLKENYGFKNYPATMNALISGEWMKTYQNGYSSSYYPYTFTKDQSGLYIRVSGELTQPTRTTPSSNSDRYVYAQYVFDTNNEWVSESAYIGTNYMETVGNNYDDYSIYVKNPVPSTTGEYMVSASSLASIENDAAYNELVADYRYNLNYSTSTLQMQKSNSGSYVRLDGELILRGYNEISNSEKVIDMWGQYVLNEDNKWTGMSNYRDANYDADDITYNPYPDSILNYQASRSLYIKNPVLSANGRYLVWVSTYSDYYYKYIANSGYRYKEQQQDDERHFFVKTGGNSKGPEFNIPAGIDQGTYNSTLYNTMQTNQTMSYLLLMNILSCNPNGFNTQLDNILDIFGTKYNNAKAVAAEISQESIELPSALITALHLNQMLGTSTIKIGKAEVDVLFAATDIVKGLFQWLSSYDLSMDVKDSLWNAYGSNGSDPIAMVSKVSNANTLSLRNATAMDESKATILGALNSVLSSYTYVTETSGTYPSSIKATIKQYGDSIYGIVADCATALRTGTVFELDIPNTVTLSLDLGKLFTPGYLSDIYAKDSAGNIKATLKGYYYSLTDSYSSGTRKLLSNPVVLDFTKNVNSQFDTAIKANLPWSNISSNINTIYVGSILFGYELNEDLLNDLISLTVDGDDVINDVIIANMREMRASVVKFTYTR